MHALVGWHKSNVCAATLQAHTHTYTAHTHVHVHCDNGNYVYGHRGPTLNNQIQKENFK